MYSIRIDIVVEKKSITRLLKGLGRVCYVTEKVDTNPHIHAYLETDIKDRTIRERIRKVVGSGNRSYSMKICRDKVKYIAYMMKEGNVHNHGISESLMEEAMEYDEKVKCEMKENKMKNKGMLHSIRKYVIDKFRAMPGVTSGQYISVDQCTKFVLDYYKENEKLIREFQIVSQVQTIMLLEAPGYQYTLYRRIIDKVT